MKTYSAYEIWRLIQNKTINASDTELLKDNEAFVKVSDIILELKDELKVKDD